MKSYMLTLNGMGRITQNWLGLEQSEPRSHVEMVRPVRF